MPGQYFLPPKKRIITLNGAEVEIDCPLVITIPDHISAIREAVLLHLEEGAIAVVQRRKV